MGVPTNNRVLFVLLSLMCLKICLSQQFDQTYTGVMFTPYVKLPVDGIGTPDWYSYTTKDIQVMLEIILEKFSNVATLGAGYSYMGSGPYIRNVTFSRSFVEAQISSVAAKMNNDIRSKRNITIIQGIWSHNEPHLETEVRLGIEAAERANLIHPGTVKGIIISQLAVASNYNQAKLTQKYQQVIRNSAVGDLKLGIWMECGRMFADHGDNTPDENHMKVLQNILKESDFVICKVDVPTGMMKEGPEMALDLITTSLLEFRQKLQNISTKVEVMGQLKWATSGYNSWNNIKNQKIYWETAGHWAKKNRFPIWFFEAFDNPWRPVGSDFPHSGWWKLTDNSKSDQRDGYIEKEHEAQTTSISTTMIVVSITIGMLVILTLVVVIVFLYKRGKTLEQQLSKQDIREFMEGMSETIAVEQGDHNVDSIAFKFPYDKSFEINKGQLKIEYDKILGTGQFGCVYNAIIGLNTASLQHVALKTARHDCPRSALKGLLSEIKIMMYIGKHANIVALKGAYTAELNNGIVYIATELCGLGSLKGYLRKREKETRMTNKYINVNAKKEAPQLEFIPMECEPITFPQMVQWSQEIACGMEYLGVKNVVHADLATRNVLLTQDKTAKISDFGLSRRMYEYENYIKTEQEPLPWRWMAIESLKRYEFSAKSDVWSYGITLWEIFSMGDTPYPGLSWTLDFVSKLVDGLRLARPTHAPPELYNVMIECWQPEADERPSFATIQTMIKKSPVKSGKITNRTEFTEYEKAVKC